MKPRINSMNEALAYLLQGLYYTEEKLSKDFPSCCGKIASPRIRKEVGNYTLSAQSKMLKLERVFNYIMTGPLSRKNEITNQLMSETFEMRTSSNSTNLQNIITIGCIQNINAYKIASYRSAYLFAVELELDTATDILEEILEWEIETGKVLTELALEEFNKNSMVNL